MGDPACCSWLDSFDLIYVLIGMRAPYRGGILYLRPYNGLVCCLTYAFMFGEYMSAYVVQCLICFGGHILDVVFPVKFVTNVKAKTFLHVLLPLGRGHVEHNGS